MATTLEKSLDFTLGAAILTAEALNQALAGLVDRGKLAQEHAPAVFEAIMEKGRPARETLLRNLRDEMRAPACGFGRPAPDEIQALEERVAMLEQQVGAQPGTDAATEDAASAEVAAPAEETPENDVPSLDPAVEIAPTITEDVAPLASDAEIAPLADDPEIAPLDDEDGEKA